ncbi:hypothetical protein [Streptomyces vinaceus]|uniref:hypothetical protein n=1 Tax=Streptomyces vinaceus TaxID=1960 RepID=UPI0036C96848
MTDYPPPLRPRAERCPDPQCTDEQQCWRCDAEESQHALIASMSRCPECGTPVPPTHWTKHLQRHHPDAAPAACSGEQGFCGQHGFHRHPPAGYCPHCGSGDAGPTADQSRDEWRRDYLDLAQRHQAAAIDHRETEHQLQQEIDAQAREIDRLQAADRRVRHLADRWFVGGPTPVHIEAGRELFAALEAPKERS